MSYLSELTAHERLTVDNATLDMFTAFENGSDLIYDIWEQYFSDRERKNIESRDLEFIGRILYSVYDRMANAIRDYLSLPVYPIWIHLVYIAYPHDYTVHFQR